MSDDELLAFIEGLFHCPRLRQDNELLEAMNSRMMTTVADMTTLLRGRGLIDVSEEDILRVGKSTKKVVLEEERSVYFVGPVPQSLQKSRCTLAIQPRTLSRQDVQGLVPPHTILHSFLAPESLLVTFDDERTAKTAFLEMQGKKVKGVPVVAKIRLEQYLHVTYSNQATATAYPSGPRKHTTNQLPAPQPTPPVAMMPPLFPLNLFQPFGLLPMPPFGVPPMAHNQPQGSGRNTNSRNNMRGAREAMPSTTQVAAGPMFRPPVPKEPVAPIVPPAPAQQTADPQPAVLSPMCASHKFRRDPYSFRSCIVEVKERPVGAAPVAIVPDPFPASQEMANPDSGSGGASSSDQSTPQSARACTEDNALHNEPNASVTSPATESIDTDPSPKPLSYAAMLLKPKQRKVEKRPLASKEKIAKK